MIFLVDFSIFYSYVKHFYSYLVTYFIYRILGDYIRKLFKEHPEAVFHCQKNVISYLSQFSNYFISERCFLHMVCQI